MNKSENRTKKYFSHCSYLFIRLLFFTDIHKRLKHNQ